MRNKEDVIEVDSSDLLSCPYCGGEMRAEWEPCDDKGPIHFMECMKCGSQGPKAGNSDLARRVGKLRGDHSLDELLLILDNAKASGNDSGS